MPTITTADAILTATKDLTTVLEGDIPQSQYDKGMTEKFIEVMNAKAKSYQIDKILENRAIKGAVQAQRVAAAASEDDAHVVEEVECELAPEASGPASRTRSRAGSEQRSVTQDKPTT